MTPMLAVTGNVFCKHQENSSSHSCNFQSKEVMENYFDKKFDKFNKVPYKDNYPLMLILTEHLLGNAFKQWLALTVYKYLSPD